MASSVTSENFNSTKNEIHTFSKFKEVNHTKTLVGDLEKLFQNEDCSDVILKVEGKSIPAHRVVLAMRAEYFHSLLFGGLKETTSDIVELGDDTSYRAFQEILRYIYSGKITFKKEQNCEDVLEILKLSNKYGIQDLEMAIVDHIVNELLEPENVLKVHQFNEFYEYEKLIEGCENMIIENAAKYLQEPEFLSLSAKSVYDFFSRDSFAIDEMTIFSSIKRWMEVNTNVKSEDRNLLLSAVRLHLVPKNLLHGSVRESKLFSSDAILDAIKIQDQDKITDYRISGKLDIFDLLVILSNEKKA